MLRTTFIGFATVAGLAFTSDPACANPVTEAAERSSASDGIQWLKQAVERARLLATKRITPGSEAERKWKSDVKQLINESLDWPEMTKRVLGRHFEGLSAAQRAEFANSLREMIEASYESKLRMVAKEEIKKPQGVKVDWLSEKEDQEGVVVATRVKADKTVANVDFRLRRQPVLTKKARGGAAEPKANEPGWRVYDITIDDVSTVRTYRTQFSKIIAKDGFGGLLSRMRAKIEEIRAGRADLASGT